MISPRDAPASARRASRRVFARLREGARLVPQEAGPAPQATTLAGIRRKRKKILSLYANSLKTLKTAMGRPCRELASLRRWRHIRLASAPRLIGPRDAFRRIGAGAVGRRDFAASKGDRLRSCSGPEMVPQPIEKARFAPGNGALLPLAGEGGPEGRMRAAPTAWPLTLTFSHARVGERELLRRQAAVDHDLGAGDERRFVARQKQDGVGDFLRSAEAAERRGAG